MNTHVTLLELRRYRVVDGWAELLQRYPWEWFVTHTFTESIHEEAALKSLRHWLNILNRELYGRRWKNKHPYGVYWVAAVELQKRQVIHLHLLMAGVQDTRRLTYMDIWHGLGNKNGFARIEPIESLVAASRYVCKYVSKDCNIFLSDNLPDVTAGFGRIWSDSPEQNESLSAEASSQTRTD